MRYCGVQPISLHFVVVIAIRDSVALNTPTEARTRSIQKIVVIVVVLIVVIVLIFVVVFVILVVLVLVRSSVINIQLYSLSKCCDLSTSYRPHV